MEPSGEKVDKLDYEGDSSDEEKQLTDDDVARLSKALCQNDVF